MNCKVCDAKIFSLGLCRKHYRQLPYVRESEIKYRSSVNGLKRARLRTRKYRKTSKYKEQRKKYMQRLYVKEKNCLMAKRYYVKNKELMKLRRRIRENKPEFKEKRKAYLHKPTVNAKNRKKYNLKVRTNPLFKLHKNLKYNLYFNLKKRKYLKTEKTFNLLGYTVKDLKEHLEKQFTSKMTWDNYGSYWHIDHKIPISWACTKEEIIQLYQLKNLQPLEARANIQKNNKHCANLLSVFSWWF
jgi:hypothetical protein